MKRFSLAAATTSAATTSAATTSAAVAALLLQLPVQASQPNMQAALSSLNQAKQSLERATHDKGGHRLKAIRLIDEAIQEVEAGIEAGR